jgi:hypothetical protein
MIWLLVALLLAAGSWLALWIGSNVIGQPRCKRCKAPRPLSLDGLCTRCAIHDLNR